MKKNYQNILLILICASIIMLPMFLNDYHSGHDTGYHIANVSSLREQIINGNNLNILPNIANNFGYGTRLFYPPLPHLITAFTSIATNDLLLGFKLTHFIVLFLSGVSLYFLSVRLFKDKRIAFISSIIYMAYPYHLSDIYIRDALAECFLFIFIPIILLGLTYLFENKRNFYILFVLGYVFGMISHFTMMIYFTLLLIPFFIINFKKVWKKDIILILFISAFSILLIVSPFLVTMMEHRFLGDYAVFLPNHMAGKILWAAKNPLDYINIFKNFNNNNIKYYIDFITIILLGLTLYQYKKINIKDNHIKFLLIFGLVAIIMSTFFFPWDILPQMLRMIQFPWRMITFVSIIISLFAPLCLKDKQKKYYFLTVLLLLISAYLNTNFASNEAVNLEKFDYNAGFGWQKEYLPINALENQEYLENRSYDIIADEEINVISEKFPNMTFEVTNETTIELPRLYYLGYILKDENNNQMEIKISEYGFIESNVKEGIYFLTYEGTSAYNISKIVSIITIIINVFILIGGKLWKKLVSSFPATMRKNHYRFFIK